MLKFFASVFGDAAPRRAARAPKSRLGLEELNTRILPSAGFGPALSRGAPQRYGGSGGRR